MKYCTNCQETKAFEAFSRAKARYDGYNGHCKNCIKIAKAKWRERNRDYYLEDARRYADRYRKEYPDRVTESYSKWATKNRPYLNERDRRRNAAKKSATPEWAKIDVMRVIYSLAEKKTKITNTKYQVDHIVPITSDTVCGLHVEYNLQVLPSVENQSKSNRWWPDMWDLE